MFRILFVLIAAAVITFGTILLGNYLQYKVDEAEKLLDKTAETDDDSAQSEEVFESGDNYDSPTVFGAAIDLGDYEGESDIIVAINTLAQSYDTVLMPITDADGMLFYNSPALSELVRMPSAEDDANFRLFSSAAAAVKAKNMRLCIIYTPNNSVSTLDDAALTDGTLIAELALYGADEVLITLPDDIGEISTDSAEALNDYISDCREISDNACPIGILLSSEVYLDDNSAKQIQQIASAASFLAIDFPVEDDSTAVAAYRYVSRSVTSLLGSFNVYNMRVILDGTSEHLPAKYRACSDSGISNICVASFVLPSELEYNAQSADTAETTYSPNETIDPEANTNPYATVADDETETETNPANDSADETSSDEKPWF